MKRISLLSLLSILLLFSCNKDDDSTSNPAAPGAPVTNNSGLPAELRSILADSLLVNLESRGMVINRGTTPPNVEGIFLTSPMRLLSPFGPEDPYNVGDDVSDYLFRFFNQVGVKANMDYKNRRASDTTKGLATIISGAENKFTLYAESTGESGGIPYKAVSIISGEVAPDAMNNLQFSFTLTSKTGDPQNFFLVAPGKSRIYKDANGVSPKKPSYNF